jgi:hypothetical protein
VFLKEIHNPQLAVDERKTMKYASMDWGTMEAVVNKLGGMEGVQRFLRNETTVSEPARPWTEKDGVITFTLTSNGKTGEEWVTHLEGRGFRLGNYTKSVLRSPDFRPTPAGTLHSVAVLKGRLFSDTDRITRNIRAEATKRGYTTPHPEIACLIRDQFSDDDIKAMGLWWLVVFHEPIKDSDGYPRLLGADRGGDGRWLSVYNSRSDNEWSAGLGFAFAVPQSASASVSQP